jgi:hypothetical protein
MMRENKETTTSDKVATYATTIPLLDSMYSEFKELSKKKPDAAVSKSKISIVNRLLTRVRTVLNDEESIDFLDLLDEDNVPQMSDVTLILSQYVAAMKEFCKKYYRWDDSEHRWFT